MIDASGSSAWLSRVLKNPVQRYSPPLFVRYGYCAQSQLAADSVPKLASERSGWSWYAPIRDGRLAWVRLTWDGVAPAKPSKLAELDDLGPPRGADVTWRRPTVTAGRDFFICGDAAGMIDPCSSHGVLRAMMSGMMASYQAGQALGGTDRQLCAHRYQRWLGDWWDADTDRLRTFYAEFEPRWIAQSGTLDPHLQ